jgi:cytochrome c
MKKVMAFAALAVFTSASAFAADGATLYAEKTCAACHGKDGKKTLMPDYPKIAGQNKAYVMKQMMDIKSGARANGNSAAMKGVMVIVSDDEIKTLADFISQMKP